MSQLFRRKPIAALIIDESDKHALKRVLGAGDLVMLAIGAVIGAGIFGAIGTAAAGQVAPDGTVIRTGPGPALVFSFLLLGGACALAALCYAELASMIPQAGVGLRVYLRDAWRAGGLDHWLGPDSGICRRQRRGRHLVGRLLQHPGARRGARTARVAHHGLPDRASEFERAGARPARECPEDRAACRFW